MTEEKKEQSVRLDELAEMIGGRLRGDPAISISGVASLDTAGPEEITFLANAKLKTLLPESRAAAIVATSELEGQIDKPLLLVENPYLAFAHLLTFFRVPPFKAEGVSEQASVHPEATVAAEVTVSPGCVIEAGARIGPRSTLHPNVVIYKDAVIGADCILHSGSIVREGCRLGDRVILQPGAVVGADGFGFAADGEAYVKIPQVGRVIVEDDVEIGASATIDRGTLGDTRIGRGTKIDNLVQVGHNVRIGENCILVSQVGIAGSTQIGKHCTFGGQAGVTGHVTIGDHVTIAGRGGVINDVPDATALAGMPPMPHREWLRVTASLAHLPELRREVSRLRQQLSELEALAKGQDDES